MRNLTLRDPSYMGALSVAPPPLGLSLRFADTKSLIDLVSGQNLITFTRASSATYIDSDGAMKVAAVNVPRFDHNPTTGESLGLLVEEARTNSIRNNTMVGAVAGTPGTLPTNWIYAVGSGGGISRDIVGTGTENGINYIDIRFYGTTTSIAIGIDSATAATGQTWTGSLYWKLVGGSMTGIIGSSVGIIEATSSGSFVAGNFYAAANPSSSALSLQRVSATRTLSGGATVGICTLVLNFNCTGSTAIDITLRIGLPQLEQGAFATSVILTSGATATRNADIALITGTNFSSWYNQTEGTIFAEYRQYATGGSVVNISDNTGLNFMNIFTSVAANIKGSANVFTSGTNNGQIDSGGTFVANTNTKASYGLSVGSRSFSVGGNTVTTSATPTALPTVNRINIGVNQDATSGWNNGHIRRIDYWPQRLPNSMLRAVTS